MVKKTDFNAKATEIEAKIPSMSGLATNSALTAVENKMSDVSNVVKKANLDAELKKISNRVTSNKSRHLQIEDKLKKIQTFDAAYFRGKSHFEEDWTQNYLVFQPMHKYFKRIAVVIIYNFGNLKVCLMKSLIRLLHLTIKLLQD